VTDGSPRERLAAGGTMVGTLVMEFDSTGIARVAAAAGADFVMFDLEHTGWSMERLRELIASARGTAAAPFARVPSHDHHLVSRALDVGARGLMVPAVESAEQAAELVASARFPPAGRRRFGLIYSDELGDGLAATMERHNAEIMLIGQIETVDGIRNVAAIAAVDGIDVLWLGPYDLSISMGIPGEFTHPDYLAAVDKFLAACRTHGRVPGVLVESVAEGLEALERGYRCLMYNFDAALYEGALRAGLEPLKRAAGEAAPQ
jgi:2-keto-3-deoxy-L-rhamnonate aldolase RhmA